MTFPFPMICPAGASKNAVDYDGSAAYLQKTSLTGLVDGTQGFASIWFRLDGGDGTLMSLLASGTSGVAGRGLLVSRTAANKLEVRLKTSTRTFTITSTSSFLAGATWRHLITSWDTNFAAAAKLGLLYIDGADETNKADPDPSFTTGYTTDTVVAAVNSSHTSFFNGALAEVFFDPTQYVDISVSATRLKFRTSGGKPEVLGATGSVPFGAQPILYLNQSAGGAGTNVGSGGNLTINGTPTNASSNPWQ